MMEKKSQRRIRPKDGNDCEERCSRRHQGRKVMFKLYAALAGAALAISLTTSAALAQGAIATADGEQSGVRIDITELKRTSGDTLTMKFTLVNETGEEAPGPYYLFGSVHDLRDVHLIDAVGKKKYLPIKDASNNCVCSGGLSGKLASGASMNLWARFPAPAADVKEVSVVFPHFIPTDAPISE
jgi:hypothetical protein